MRTKDPYEILGVSKNASQDEIKSAYRKLARQYHPDVNPGDAAAEEKFKEISGAYQTIGDPDRRKQYDQFGTTDFSGGGGGGAGYVNLNDIFDSFFQSGFFNQQSQQQAVRGEDIKTTVEVNLEEVLRGTDKVVRVRRKQTCQSCTGTGVAGGRQPKTCQQCGGRGQVYQMRNTFFGQMQTITPCPSCRGSGTGWVIAEYSMLPRSGRQRNSRDSQRPNARSLEIQRLIGRCLRCVVDLDELGERTVTLDCDAIQADGGTRTAAITAAYVALQDAFAFMQDKRMIRRNPVEEPIAAISVGIVNGAELLDLCYEEDSKAQVDMNVIMTASGKFVEVQGTGEARPFGADELGRMLKLAKKGIDELVEAQKAVLAS